MNSKTNKANRFAYQFTDKLNLKNPNKNIALANLSIYYTWKNIKSEYNNSNFKIAAPTWNDGFNLPNGSYSVFDIQDCFKYIIKKHETITDTDSPPVDIDVNEIKNRIVFKIKTHYKLELLTEETMQLVGSSEKVINKNRNGGLAPRLEIVEVVLVQCNFVKNNYHKHLKYYLFLYQVNNLVS